MKAIKFILLLSILLLNSTAWSWAGFDNLPASGAKNDLSSFCGRIVFPDDIYYNLFSQEVIASPRYFPFLLAYNERYYHSENGQREKNENIEDWQRYLGISYEQAYYLVFKASRKDVQSLAKGVPVSGKNLNFANASFMKKQKQALLYLAYAKYLEPYMAAKNRNNRYYWGDEPTHTVEELDYEKVITVLKRSWEAETDKDLKLRYGYQLVRFAHYNMKYRKAIEYFNTYVESLEYKPIMYYYALDQKGGAERALGNYMQAHQDFFQFFTHTKNRKENAYTSMVVTRDLDFEELLKNAKTDEEKNDLYMLLGYRDFNNPMSSFEKIVRNSPDAIQAKVLIARAINQLERAFFPVTYHCPYYESDCMNHVKDYRLPILLDKEDNSFLQQTLKASIRQAQNAQVHDKAFWNLTTTYLYFIQKKYTKAQQYLSDVQSDKPEYIAQKEKLGMLLEITTQPEITSEFEQLLITKYKKYFDEAPSVGDEYYYGDDGNTTEEFIIDILANRYFLQKKYGKAFLLQNNITGLEENPDIEILEAIEQLYYKKNKNAFEAYITENIPPAAWVQKEGKYIRLSDFDFESYVAHMKGTIYLLEGAFKKAHEQFSKVPGDFTQFISSHFHLGTDSQAKGQLKRQTFFEDGTYNGYANIPDNIFGYNRIECFSCTPNMVMKTHYVEEFSFIKPRMNKREIAQALVRLEEIGSGQGEQAAKANYLIGNFFFNTSTLGYYRHILAFDVKNFNHKDSRNYFKYFTDSYRGYNRLYYEKPNYLYFKNYARNPGYIDNFRFPLTYLDRALEQTKDEELKAQILFTASKCEQGIFYTTQDDKELNALNDINDYKEQRKKRREIKASKYWNYFRKLKQYNDTDFYEKVRTNCKYFDYYLTHY